MNRWNNILCLVVITIACGDGDKPTASSTPPEPPPIVGRWQYASNNFLESIAANLRDYLADHGGVDSTAAEIIREGIEDELVNATIEFHADGRYSDSGGNAGTWQVSSNNLTLTLSGEAALVMTFEASQAELTLIHPLSQLRSLGAGDPDLQDLVDAMLQGLTDLRVHFTKVT